MSRLSHFIRTFAPRDHRQVPAPTSGRKTPLVLHIGPHKTGTTAIQAFCERNRKPLAKAGFWYPTAGIVTAQHLQLPACYLSHHHCIPEPLLGGCPEEIVADIAAEVPRGLTPLMSSEVYWELLTLQPAAFEAVVALLCRSYHVHVVMVERPVRDRLWSAVKFNARLGYACEPIVDFAGANEVDRRARQKLAAIGCPVIRVPYDHADCISPFLKALSSPLISRQTVRPRRLDALIQRCQTTASKLRKNGAPSESWFVAFTLEFARRLWTTRGSSSRCEERIASFLKEAMAIGDETEFVRRLPDEDVVLQRVVEAKGDMTSLLKPVEGEAWETICRHPALQRAAMRTNCIDELRAVTEPARQRRRAA
jgi:hypothetical protein